MKISYKWLKRYIDLSIPPRELAAILTSIGLECDTVEEVETIRGGLKGLVIGKVLSSIPHPDSDHLHITMCDLGSGEPVQIVCGAPNVAAGQTVVVATIGTILYDGEKEIKIKKSKMRGVESFGMICAEDEIGVGTSHDGIIVIPEDITPGTPAAEYFKVESDYMLEVELTPNRVDAASHLGVARDLKAWLTRNGFEKNIEAPEITMPSDLNFRPDRTENFIPVEVRNSEACPRYCGITIRNLTVGESPEWLKQLLTSVGQRPINCVVDITNFILLGLGQPLHCFDIAKIEGQKIVVDTCPQDTEFTTLDGVARKLDNRDLMICDTKRPMCIAGVFGGLDSGVTTETTDVFIESAYFNPTSIRKTARRHGLSTDASFRYERGTDPAITVYAAKIAALLIKELCGGEICGDVQDSNPDAAQYFHIDFDMEYCNRLVGKEIPLDLTRAILQALEIKISDNGNPMKMHLEVPSYRVDVRRPCDVVEEILRIYGYNNVEFGTEMHANLSQKNTTDESFVLQENVASRLSANGFREIMNNSLSSASYYGENDQLDATHTVHLMNPLSNDLAVLRRSLLFGGLESIAHNLNRKATSLRFYEFGNVYSIDPQKLPTSENPLAQFNEGMKLAIWMSADPTATVWNRAPQQATVFDLKGIVMNLLAAIGITENQLVFSQSTDQYMSAKLTISIRSGKELGYLGILSRKLLKSFDIEPDVFFAELDWKTIFRLASKNHILYTPLPKSHPVKRDLALLIDKEISFARIEEIVREAERKLLRDVWLFDVYEGKNLPTGKKSYAISMILQDPEKTLQDKQIDSSMARITIALQEKLGAELR